MSDILLGNEESFIKKVTVRDYVDAKLKSGELDNAFLERIAELQKDITDLVHENDKEVDALRSENERYKTALEEIKKMNTSKLYSSERWTRAHMIAREALKCPPEN